MTSKEPSRLKCSIRRQNSERSQCTENSTELGEADHADPAQNSIGAGVQDRLIARVGTWCFKGVLQAFCHYFLSDQIN
jgi:hypothetical protein